MIKNWKFDEKFVYFADDDSEFIQKVYDAYNDDTEELRLNRFKFAKTNTWDNRVQELMKCLKNM